MITYKTEITIDRPVDKVFGAVADVEMYPQWMNVESAKIVSEGPAGLGGKAVMAIKMGPWKIDLTTEVTEWEVNRKLSFKTISTGPLDWAGSFAFEPGVGSSTRVASSGQLRLRGLMRLLEPLMAGEVQKGEAAELVKLKGLLEADA